MKKTKGYWAIASNYFDNKNWSQSANFYLKTAEEYRTLDDSSKDKKICSLQRPELLRNAAAAQYNNNNYNGVIEAIEKLIEMKKDPSCKEEKINHEITKNLKEVDGMARMMVIKNMGY